MRLKSSYRLLQSLTALNITVVSTMEVSEATEYLRFSPHNISFLSDDIIALRYVELNGALCSVLGVIKTMIAEQPEFELRLRDLTGDE